MNGLFSSLQQIPAPTLALWGLVTFIAISICAVLVRAEGRYFRRIGRSSAWFKLRIATLPILVAAVFSVIVVFSMVGGSGMEALAIAYLVLFTVGPMVHFGLHWQLGKVLGLRSTQAAWVAFSGLFLLGIIPAFATLMQPVVHSAARLLNGQQKDATTVAPLPYRQVNARRLQLPNMEEVWAIHYQAAADIRLVKVDMETATHRAKDMLTLATSTMCRRQQDLHVLWPADRPLPLLYAFWKDSGGQVFQSAWKPEVPEGVLESLQFVWGETEVTLPIAISREALSYAWEREDRSPIVDSLQGSSPYGECAGTVISLPVRDELGRATALRLRTDHSLPKGPTWADFSRPEATVNE